MDPKEGEKNRMSKDLVMYYPPDLEIIFVPTERDYFMEFLDNVSLHQHLQMHQEVKDKVAGGFYDRI